MTDSEQETRRWIENSCSRQEVITGRKEKKMKNKKEKEKKGEHQYKK